MELVSSIVGKRAVIYKKDGFKKAGKIINYDPIFVYLKFDGSGTVEAIPLAEISHIKIEGVDVDGGK